MQSPRSLRNHPNKRNIIFVLVLSIIFTTMTIFVAYKEYPQTRSEVAFQIKRVTKGEGSRIKNAKNHTINISEN